MKRRISRVRLSKSSAAKLRERSAVLYGRELDRWNWRAGGYPEAPQG